MKRDYTQLPSLEELKEILATESIRKVSEDKKFKHYVAFGPIKDLLIKLDIQNDFFERDFVFEDLRESDIQRVEDLIKDLASKIITTDKSLIMPLLDALYDYLTEEDSPETSDLIFVFGSASNYRIDKAIELYKKGLSKIIMISGKGPHYGDDEVTEADKLALYAVDKGVLENDIIKETRSITLPDNVKSSLNMLDKKVKNVKSIILVNSPFAQRRGWAHFNKFCDHKLYRVNSDISFKFDKDHWFEQEETIKVIINEFVKMKLAQVLNLA